MRVLLFEENAHYEHGHYAEWVVRVATTLAADGHDVHVLTRHGGVDGRAVPGASATYRMTRRHRLLGFVGTEIRRLSWAHLGASRGRPLAVFGDSLRQCALGLAIRHRAGTLGAAVDLPVMVLSKASPVELAALAPRHGRWTVYEHDAPDRIGGAVATPRLVRIAGRFERRRARTGGFLRLVANNAHLARTWRETVPWTDPVVIRSAGRDRVEPVPRREARAALGLPADEPLALHFGVVHGGKDFDTVMRAFAGDDAPARLVVAGKYAATRVDAFRSAHPELPVPKVTVFDGHLDDEAVRRLHSAADVAVLSFFPSWPNDSGTLGDAVSHGLPVCCSDTGDVGRIVERHGIGAAYPPGDAAALRAAVARVAGGGLPAEAQAGYLDEFSNRTLTRQLLAITVS
jgi:glycosyltransferase involved in cell wall biosynthesis